jgi:hypothetical protein
LANNGAFAPDGATELIATQVVGAHLDGAGNAHRSSEDARPNVVSRQRAADSRRDDGGRDPWVDREIALAHYDRLVYDDRVTQIGGLRSDDHSRDVRRNEVTRLDEDPVARLFADLRDNLIRR